jgi:hypothetical protein
MTPLPGFRPDLLDFKRGIHVGNLEENERITRILKLALEARYGQPFVTERWGRGVYWRWIGFLARANREAKPISSKVSFGCAKYFISLDPEESTFKCGMQVERGYLKPNTLHLSTSADLVKSICSGLSRALITGNFVCFRFTPRRLRRPRLEFTRCSRISVMMLRCSASLP